MLYSGPLARSLLIVTPDSLIRPELRALSPYHVPDASGLIKLDAMENPYSWPVELVDGWLDALRGAAINRYPHPQAPVLKARLREVMAIPADCELILGNGSDELIQLLALGVAAPGRVLLAPEPSFVMYRMIAQFVSMAYVGVPLRANDFALDTDAMLAAIEQHRPALVFLAYPNNPTGNLFAVEAIEAIIAATPGLVVLDEAYFAFTDASFMARLGQFPNLLLMRTVSKLGLAGLRLGLLAGPKPWLTEFEKLRLPYNINSLTQISADFALAHHELFAAQVRRIRADRIELQQALAALPGITVYPSEANFILFRAPIGRGESLFRALLKAGILIKNLSAASALLQDCLRVTVGRPEENQAFLTALRAAL